MYGAVLADGMGLGKTFQTIASLYSLLTKGINGQPTCRKPLILCPTSLVQNWGKELKLWLGERVVPVVVDDTRADHVKKSFQEFRAFGHGGKPKVLVMSYPCFRMHKAEVYRMGLDVVMCDEAHFLKNGEAQITQAVAGLASAKRRLLMSGTPIQNDLSEFHAVFDLACPGLLGDLKAFNKTYEGPIQRGRDADATEKQVTLGLERMEQLMKLCNKFMLRRTSTVLKALLPAKVEQVMVLEALLKGIKASEPTDKVVLVSNYTEALDVLGGMCASHGWPALRLDGSCSVKQRQALVDTFNSPEHPSFVLLLSSKAGGVGLNIIGANRLVLFDPDWNPANDLQAMARVWREGQRKRVWIYRLLIAGSIEEKVLQRQLAKQGLSKALVDDVGQQVRTFSRDELRSLFRVDPTTPCDTHQAIKCSCSGSLQDLDSCKERAAAAAAAAAEGAGSGAEQQGVLGWAHLARALDSPDPTWQAVSDFVRNNFVTYIFSDHVIGETQHCL
ncbi:P-loop containing nucleoside triphosphate hydrolase protein [Scenedesmus sp. NREL 46B-D3]|nr:P-loop containing nucleoside triphosphate hydrolase protein [Scenedesmus sp. NREL 46B-D3]